MPWNFAIHKDIACQLLADHALSGWRYLTYTKHLSQLSRKVNARCNDWPEQNGEYTLMYPKHQQLDSRPAVWRIEQSSIKSKEKKTVAQLWGIGQTEVVKVLQAGRQLLELENNRAAFAGVVHGSILHSQRLTIDIKKLKQCCMFGQRCGNGKQQSKHCFRNKAEVSTPND